MQRNERVSIVVITRNRQQELCETLNSLCALPEQPDVIVVDNGSSDESVRRARAFPHVRVIEAEGNLGAAARFVGLEKTETPYVAFADDDVRWQPGSLARGCELLNRFPKVAVLTAKVLLHDSDEIDPTCLEMAHSPLASNGDAAGPCLLGFLAGASVARRSALMPSMQAFPQRLIIGGEEQWIAAHLAASGWLLCYAEELIARHYPSACRNARQRRRWQTRNAIWFAWLRRPVYSALRSTARIVAGASQTDVGLWPCITALASLPKMIGQRQVVPRNVEAMFQLLEKSNGVSHAHGDSNGKQNGH